ncbi:MAG: 16S rRNA processing protein RimM [Myxococcales bacterium 68-20]|nr:MAG: 16S rRNA processing protein RimM [Myxococcales bacterium 68-20]
MTDVDAWVPLAEIARPHGVRGEVRLKVFNKTSDVLLQQDEVLVRMSDGEEHEVSVVAARRADDAILMKLYSVDDRDRADELRGALVCVRRRDFPPAEEGEFYTIDLVGAEVRVNAERLGVVVETMSYPTLEALLVRADDGKGDWEIPLTETYVGKIDTSARVIDVLTLDELERLPLKKPKKPKKGAKRGGEGEGEGGESAGGEGDTGPDEA